MDINNASLSPPPRIWLAWACLLLAIYLAVAVAASGRTMIGDEIWALLYAGRPFNEQLEAIRLDLVHPPLIYLIERGWLHTFGHSDSTAKALALVINIPTLVLFTWLASHVTGHWRLTSWLFSSMYLYVGSVPNLVRMYGLALLWTVVAILLWEQWRGRPRARTLILWLIVMALLVYTHYIGLLLLVAFVAVNWWYGPRRWVFTAAAVFPGFAFLPWFLYVLPVYLKRGLQPNVAWVDQASHRAAAKLPYFFLSNVPAGWNPFAATGWVQKAELQSYLIVVAGVIHLVLFGLAWRTIRQLWPPLREGDRAAQWFWTAALLFGMPVLLLYGFSVAITPTFHARFLIGVLPGYWLLMALLAQFGGRAGRAMLYGVVFPWVLVSVCVGLVQNLAPSPVREGTLLVSREIRETDLILCSGEPVVGAQVYWEWTRRLAQPGRIEILSSRAIWWASILPQKDLKELNLYGVDRVWFFYSNPKAADQMSNFLAAHGFALEKPLKTRTPFLLAFAKEPGRPVSMTKAPLTITQKSELAPDSDRILAPVHPISEARESDSDASK